MANYEVLGPYERQVIYKANSGGIRFKMRTTGHSPELTMIACCDPNICLYKLTFGIITKVYNVGDRQEETFPSNSLSNFNEFKEYYLTWHNNEIKFGIVASPVILKSISCKKFSERLQWCPMINGKLPTDALIGGFENELIYVARAAHQYSLCPGKYVPSTGKAFIPWGHQEHAKEHFEILCGFNAKWVKTRTNYIPQNAFIGGHSEVNNEPLYIGRAMIEGKLVCGKVHLLYKTCYLPFLGQEVEQSIYEILVIPGDEIPQAIPLPLF